MERLNPDFFVSFVWKSHSYFQAGKTDIQKEAISQTEQQQKMDQEGHVGGRFTPWKPVPAQCMEIPLQQSKYLAIHSLNASYGRELTASPKTEWFIPFWLGSLCVCSNKSDWRLVQR
jgi:hypothetical protein